MRWPFRRRKPAAEPIARPHREWARLAPLAPVGLRPEPEVASTSAFQSRLATRWQQPPILEPLGHEVSLSAPPGLTSSIVAPVQGYSNAPDLPLLPVAGAPPSVEDQPLKPFIRYDGLRGTRSSPAPLGAAEPSREPRSVEPAPQHRGAPLLEEPHAEEAPSAASSPPVEESPPLLRAAEPQPVEAP